MWWWLLVIIFLVIFYLYIKWVRISQRYNHIPSPNYLFPFLGHVFQLPGNKREIIGFEKRFYRETNSKITMLWVLAKALPATMDVKIFEPLLTSQELIRKPDSYKLMSDWLGDSLAISNGEKWKFRRRLMTPAFHFGILRENVKIMNYHSNAFVKHIRKRAGKNLEISSLAKEFTMGVICEAAMGISHSTFNMDCNSDVKKYIEAVEKMTHYITKRITKPWLYNKFIYKNFSSDGKKYFHYVEVARNFVQHVVESKIEKLREKNQSKQESNSPVLVDILISAYQKNQIDVDGIIEETNAFMFGGHDTTASGISWTLYCIGRDERVQNKLFQEIVDNVADIGQFSYDAIMGLKYLDCVVKESLRLHPPVPGFLRHFKDETTLNNMKIPANTTMNFHIYHLHRDESLWENASVFQPERFLNDDFDKRNPFKFVPFSAGPRNCIGQRFAMLEMKLVLIHLLKSFRIVSLQEEHEIEEVNEIIHTSAKGLWLNFFERE